MNSIFIVNAIFFICLGQAIRLPSWVHLTPERGGRVYAVGRAPLGPSQAVSMQEAVADARTQVVASLRVSVSSSSAQQKISSVQTEGKNRHEFDQSRFASNSEQKIQAVDLPGITIEATFADHAGKTAYALAFLDVAVAEKELQGRWVPLRDKAIVVLDMQAQGPRERLKKLSRLRALSGRFAPVSDLASLVSAASPSNMTKIDVESILGRMEAASESLKASLTFAIRGTEAVSTGGDMTDAIKNALLRHGFEWSDQTPQLLLIIRSTETPRQGELTSIRAAVNIRLEDAAGTSYETFDLEARGVGTDMIQAKSKLMKDIRSQLPNKLDSWLNEITR